ncbi:Predicted arabinose efflux permease, MFS family [Cohnella sp. OV330]|uniref:MFS transporter n=1 Tax=Cohnella sp. OV330 TaxID=1855288 RepID=UPI0008EE8052|nr:MFS transporter [Cohnella sp. OV330]SFB21511.1 Predicted arabinose efflux permease, MFS family [Cohnella sp. OV330]
MNETERTAPLWTKAFIGLTLGFFLLFLNLQMLLSSLPVYVKGELGGGDLTVSLVTATFALAAIASRFATAALMPKLGRTALLYAGLAVAVLTTFLCAYADAIGSLIVIRVLYGVGFGTASTIVPTLVARIIPQDRIGEGIGYFGLSTSLAMSLGPMIGMNLMTGLGFPALTLSSAAAAALSAGVLLLSGAVRGGKRDSRKAVPGAAAPKSEAAIKETSKASAAKSDPTPNTIVPLLFPALLNMLLSVTYSGLLSFIALFGESVHIAQVGLFFLFNAITVILVRPIAGRIFDRRGHAAVLIPAAACVLASMLVLSGATGMPQLIASALLYGLGFGAIQPTLQAWMLRSTPRERHGFANSMYYNSTDLGVAIGAVLLGAVAAHTGYARMYGYSALIMAGFLVLYIAMRFVAAARASKAGSQPSV